MGLVALVGVIALAVGVAVTVRESTVAFGWFAYAPMSEERTLPRVLTDQMVAGGAVSVAGLVLLAGCAGYVLARRTARPGPGRLPDAPDAPGR